MQHFLKKLGFLVLELVVFGLVIFAVFQYRGGDLKSVVPAVEEKLQKAVNQVENQQKELPQLEDPAQKDFIWKYKGVTYKVSETLYKSLYDFYAAQPKEYKYFGTPDVNWEEQYYAQFITNIQGDDSILKLTNDIAEQGKKQKLNDDQIAELVLAFVQTIPYDDAKAKLILSGSGETKIAYPYETIFTNSGVCSDKSFLATVMLRSLGYGTAIFTYEKENHMAIGVECPIEYSNYQSGYCYAETTSVGNKIGIIPNLDTVNNRASALIAENDSGSVQKQLSTVKIFNASVGKEYLGIKNTLAQKKELETLKIEINKLSNELTADKKTITSQQNELENLKSDLKKHEKAGDFVGYNKLVEEFNALLEKNKKLVAAYNKSVSLYNQKVKRYNALLQE